MLHRHKEGMDHSASVLEGSSLEGEICAARGSQVYYTLLETSVFFFSGNAVPTSFLPRLYLLV